ncbi:MAG TPA: hypothetical protein VJN71_11335, partial [Nitrososphaerales archaeon]|nr:hypothetical protein [Nitrososphaerales archaeon]
MLKHMKLSHFVTGQSSQMEWLEFIAGFFNLFAEWFHNWIWSITASTNITIIRARFTSEIILLVF